jgi:hypothetical protein
MGRVRVELVKAVDGRTVIDDESLAVRLTDYGVIYFDRGVGGGALVVPWHTVGSVRINPDATEILSRPGDSN